jgi:hypothetical protein
MISRITARIAGDPVSRQLKCRMNMASPLAKRYFAGTLAFGNRTSSKAGTWSDANPGNACAAQQRTGVLVQEWGED